MDLNNSGFELQIEKVKTLIDYFTSLHEESIEVKAIESPYPEKIIELCSIIETDSSSKFANYISANEKVQCKWFLC